jgi:hypothetical protein
VSDFAPVVVGSDQPGGAIRTIAVGHAIDHVDSQPVFPEPHGRGRKTAALARFLHCEGDIGRTPPFRELLAMPFSRLVSPSFVNALAASACLLAVTARGEVISSNLSDPNPDGGSFVTSAFPQRAQAFSTTASGTQISTIKMDLGSSTVGQPFSIKLYSTGTSGVPGSALTTLFSGTGGDILFGASPFTISGLNLNLAPSTQYYVVMEGAGTFSGQWNYNLETTGNGGGFVVNNSLSQTSVDNWQGVSTAQPYRMEIVAVPEPPAIVLSGIGLASALYAMRRRRG